jgi:hypothetical protein
MVPCFEVRHTDDVVGRVSLDQIRRGREAGKVPAGSEARRVTPWGPIEKVVELDAPVGRERKPCFEVRHGEEIVGPVSLDQIRRGRAAGKIPDGSAARIVWPWIAVDEVLSAPEKRLPALFEAADDGRRWYILFGDAEPIGPLATDKVFKALAIGDLPTWAPLREQGTEQWHPARSIPVFQRVAARAKLSSASDELPDSPTSSVAAPARAKQPLLPLWLLVCVVLAALLLVALLVGIPPFGRDSQRVPPREATAKAEVALANVQASPRPRPRRSRTLAAHHERRVALATSDARHLPPWRRHP